MAVDEQLLDRAKRNPAGLTFDEAVKLAEQLGWNEVRKIGSHRIFHHPLAQKIKEIYPRPLNLQRGKNGKAKEYQVRQMLERARGMGVIE